MTFTTLTGDLHVTTTGEPQGDRSCVANLLHLPGTMMSYALSMGPYEGVDGTYALAVQIGDMPLSADYMQTDIPRTSIAFPHPRGMRSIAADAVTLHGILVTNLIVDDERRPIAPGCPRAREVAQASFA